MTQEARFPNVKLPQLTTHSEPIFKPERNDRKQKTNTMPERKRGKWEESLPGKR